MKKTGENPSKESIERIDELVGRIESLPDPAARGLAVELVQGVMSLHAQAIARMLESIGNDPGTLQAMTSDDLVSSVLAMHGLHPDDLDTRVRRAIDKLERYFDSRGAGITLLQADAELVRVRFTSSRNGSADAAKQLIEDTIYEAAPEIPAVVVEGLDRRDAGFVPLADLVATQQP